MSFSLDLDSFFPGFGFFPKFLDFFLDLDSRIFIPSHKEVVEGI